MTQKTKTLILIGIILLATLIAIVYVFNQQKVQRLEQEKNLQDQAMIQDQNTKDNTSKDKAKTVIADTVNGKVSSISKDSLVIDAGGTKTTFAITENTSVFAVDGKKIEKKTIADIKEGDSVSVMTNQEDNSVLSIQVGKDAGSVF